MAGRPVAPSGACRLGGRRLRAPGDPGRPWEPFARGPFTSDFHDARPGALGRGRLHVDPEVASIEGFVVDGKTHLYYGIVPALPRVPLAAFTTP